MLSIATLTPPNREKRSPSQTTKKSKSFRKNTLKQTQCEPSLWLSKVRRKTFPYYWPIKKKYVEWRHSKTNALFITEMPLLKCGKRSQGKIHVRKEKFAIIKAPIFRFCSFFFNSLRVRITNAIRSVRRAKACPVGIWFFYANLLTGNEAEMGAHR